MKWPPKATAVVTLIATASAAAVTWQIHKLNANKQLVEKARTSQANAERGDAKAETELGSMYYYGQGVSQDYVEALRWFRKAADQGDARAECNIGYMYNSGQGVPQDYSEALRWYQKSAGQGEARAQVSIGAMYYDGRGVRQDRAVAANWYHRAADQGLAKAQYDLGHMYYYGQGMPVDHAEAYRWYHKAADQGYEYAQRALGLRSPRLSIWNKITLAALALWCLWILKGSLASQELRNRQQRALALTALFGLIYVGLNLYGIIVAFHSVLAVNAYYFAKSLVAGMSIAMGISVFAPKRAQLVLGASGVLLIGMNSLVIARHELKHFASTIRGFSTANGLLLGISIPLIIFLRRRSSSEVTDTYE